MAPREPHVPLDLPVNDGMHQTTCYMCACRCGINVHLRNGKPAYIEGNRAHPVNRGVICGKGAAGIMQHYSPAKLANPLLRTGPRGSGQFKAISWDEAMDLAVAWLEEARAQDPRRLAFFTGRDQSQALTGWFASQYGTPNYAAHGGFCSVNMAAGGLYTIGGSFWEFGEPDWERARLLLLFGCAEDHDSNPIKIGLGRMKGRGGRVVAINPVRTGYGAIADQWIGIRPGTDGLLVGALIHELLRADRLDLPYLARYTNLPWLVVRDPGGPEDGLFARDGEGRPLALDRETQRPVPASGTGFSPALVGEVVLEGGRKGVPAFQLVAERFLDGAWSPEAVAGRCGVPAPTIRGLAAEVARVAFEETITVEQPWTDWAGREHPRFEGRPVAMHAMRGISAHSNGFHTCRMIHLLQALLGTIDVPGGFRYKPPFPKPCPPPVVPKGRLEDLAPGKPLGGPPLGFPTSPDDLLVDADGEPVRIDKAYSWEAPLAAHGVMHTVITNAARGDPHPVDVLMLYMANMAWNSAMNVPATLEGLTAVDEATGAYRIKRLILFDAFCSETVAYADLVLPDTGYLERFDCISLLDRPIGEADAAGDAIRHPIVAPDRDVRPFQDVLIELGTRLGLPGFVRDDGTPRYPGLYADYIVNHERSPGIGPLAGWRGKDGTEHGRGEPNPSQIQRYIEAGGFWHHPIAPEARFMKHANRAYLDWAVQMGFLARPEPIVLHLYGEPLQRFRLAAEGHGHRQPPERHRERVRTYFDPVPFWYPPFEDGAVDAEGFPLHAITQRPMAMYHSWGSQNAWLRQIHGHNRLFVAEATARRLGLEDDDWAEVASAFGTITVRVRRMAGVNPDTVWTWNAIGKRSGAWNLTQDAPEAETGFLLNHLIGELLPPKDGHAYANSDPVTGQAAWYDLRVRLKKVSAPGATLPRFAPLPRPPGVEPPPVLLQLKKLLFAEDA